MPDTSWQNALLPMARLLQIIVSALIGGCMIFLGVVLVMPAEELGNDDGPLLLTGCAIAFAAMILFVRAIVPGVIAKSGRQKIRQGTWKSPAGQNRSSMHELLEGCGDAGKLAMLALPRAIISAALLEGAALFLLIAYMIERSPWSLAVAGVLIAGLLLQIPTHGRLVRWVEDQLRLLEQERQFDRPA